MQSIINGQGGYIDSTLALKPYSVLICKNYKSQVKLKIAKQKFFFNIKGMAIRKQLNYKFKQNISKV